MNDLDHEYVSRSEEDTMRIGWELSRTIAPGAIVALFGDLGSGKTIFTKGFCGGFSISPELVNSPTFIIINQYAGSLNQKPLIIRHFDFYRLNRPDEIYDLGLEEFLEDADAVSIIEWPEKISAYLRPPYWKIQFEVIDNQSRKLAIRREL